MSSFDWKKNIEDSLRDGLIIIIGAIEIFFELRATNVKPPKTSLDDMDNMKFKGGICGGVLVKDCAVYKHGPMCDTIKKKKIIAPWGHKI